MSGDGHATRFSRKLTLIARETAPPPLSGIPWFWRFFDLEVVLVLSAAVLVIVIEVSIIPCTGLGDTIEFHRSISTRSLIASVSIMTEHRSRSKDDKLRIHRDTF
jgi:hypothetical protein